MPGVLSGLLILPLIGAALILLVRGEDEAALSNIRYIALLTTLVTFLLSLGRLVAVRSGEFGLPACRAGVLGFVLDHLQARC